LRGGGGERSFGFAVPCTHTRVLFSHEATILERSSCDGCDSPRSKRPEVGHDKVVVTLRGRFSVRHRTGRVMADPVHAVMFRGGEEYDTHHPDGGDEDLLVRTAALTAGFEPWRVLPVGAAAQARLYELVARLELGEVDVLEVDEVLAAVFDLGGTAPRGTARARAVAEEIAHEVATRFDEPLPLAAIASKVSLSPFAATRLFRDATGFTIHQYQLELRLRHALALLHETDSPLAEIALATGFANQGHFGNHFRRRYGLPPGEARRAATQRTLAARLPR
jgi:AraC-like DNA-binding protein